MLDTKDRITVVRSRYTLAEFCHDSQEGIMLNSLSGACDIVPQELIAFIRTNETITSTHNTMRLLDEIVPDGLDLLIDRGYYVESREVELAVAQQLAQQKKESARLNSQPKYVIGLTLKCNLSCSYCWQVLEHGNSRQKDPLMTDSMIEAAFDYIDTDVSARKDKVAFISLFGGEPLIDVAEHHRIIQIIGQNTIERGHKLHITTNGRQLHAFRKEVELYCASMQVTIDGALVNKDKVTLTRDGKRLTDLYETLIDISRNKNKDIMIRFLVSEETVKDFIQFSDKLFEDETSDAKLTLAVAPIQNKAGIVEESIPKHRILQKLVAALKGKWYSPKIAYMDWRSLAIFSRLRGGEKLLPSATFYHCEANVGLVSFDSSGFIYSCYEAMGNEAYAVGRFWPETSIDKHHLNQYRERNSFSMELCSSCALSPYCGGGCEVRGRKQTGSYMLPFCDDLHQEFSYILKHWRDVQPTIGGEHEPGI